MRARYVKELSKYAPKVTTKFDVKYVKSLPNISSEILTKFKAVVWTVMAVEDEHESEESSSDDDMSVKHETEEDEDSGEDEPSPPRSKRASKGTSKSPIKKATAQRSKKEKKGSGISWDTILENTRRTRKCKSSKAKKESSDDGDTESEKSHSDSVLTASEELSVHASDDDFVVADEDEGDADSKASYKPSEGDDSDEESASERDYKGRPSKRSSRRAAAAFKAGGEKKQSKKKATKKVASSPHSGITDSDDDSAVAASLSLTGSNIKLADKMERLRNEIAVTQKAMDEEKRKQAKKRKRRAKRGVPSSASDSDGDVPCPETPEERAIASAKRRAAIRDQHCASQPSQASTTVSMMMLKAREDPLPPPDEAEILEILKAPNPTTFWHSEPALSAWPETLPEGAANLLRAAKSLDLLQAKVQATAQRAVVQAVPLSVDGLARPWAVDPTTSAPAPATSNEPSA